MSVHTDRSGPNALSESLVKEALTELDWPRLQSHLDSRQPTDLEELIGYIARCSSIIRPYPDPDFETRRTSLVHHICSYATARFDNETADRILVSFTLIENIERGYRQILSTLSATAINQRTPEMRIAAALCRLWHEVHALNETVQNQIGSPDDFNVMWGGCVEDKDGNIISPDAVLDALSRSITMTLIMEAWRNGWFRPDGIIQLPVLPDVSDDVILEAESTYVLALAWGHWRHIETSKRFLGGHFRRASADEFDGLPEHIAEVVRYFPSDGGPPEAEVYDAIANSRLQDIFLQTGLELEIKHKISRHCVGIEDGAALPPHQFVSWEEYLADSMLADLLGYDPIDDDSAPRGLRLIEWVRGYAVLKEMAKSSNRRGGIAPAQRSLRVLDLNELRSQLEKCGLEAINAQRFIDAVSLSRRSVDAFDCPLVRVGPRDVILLTPLLPAHNIVLALLSNLAREGEHLSRKGMAFEDAVRRVFTREGITAIGFSANRDGEIYEFDAVVPWDCYIFVLECKNRSLPSADPTSTYYFDLDVKSAACQVRRLADALVQYPDILHSRFGPGLENHEIVPCVVNSLPYARLGDINGVYFTDFSALSRFFRQRYLHVDIVGRDYRVPILDFWQADRPSVSAFLDQLRKPFQVQLAIEHLDSHTINFPLSESIIGQRYELVLTERTTESICEVLGVDAVPILDEISKASRSPPSP